MNWNANIEKVSNGYRLDELTEEEDLTTLHKLNFEEAESYSVDEARKAELDTFVKLVRELADYFAVGNSKHERYNLTIEVEDSTEMERE